MFKKTLLAVTIAAMSTGAFATTSATTADTLSRQGIASETSVDLNSADLVVTLGAEYAVGDTITFTVSGATIDTATTAATLTAVMPDVNDTMTLGLLSTTANTITFRVTEITYDGLLGETSIGAVLTLAGVMLDTDSVVAASSVSVNVSSMTSTSLDLDTDLDKTVLTVVDQFTTSATKVLNGVIDVENNRTQFTVGDDSTITDALVITPVDDATVFAATEATYTGATYVVSGDFSFMDTDADGAVSGAELTAGLAVAVSSDDVVVPTLSAAMDELTLTATDAGAGDADVITATFTVAGPVLEVQDFSYDATIAYDDAQGAADVSVTETAASAGAWTINGSQITFSYVPVGYDHINTNFEIANSGNQDGEISLDAFDAAGNTYSAVFSSAAEAGKVTKLGNDDIVDLFGLTAGTKLSLTITTAAPAADIKIAGYSNYNSTGRMTLLSDAYE